MAKENHEKMLNIINSYYRNTRKVQWDNHFTPARMAVMVSRTWQLSGCRETEFSHVAGGNVEWDSSADSLVVAQWVQHRITLYMPQQFHSWIYTWRNCRQVFKQNRTQMFLVALLLLEGSKSPCVKSAAEGITRRGMFQGEKEWSPITCWDLDEPGEHCLLRVRTTGQHGHMGPFMCWEEWVHRQHGRRPRHRDVRNGEQDCSGGVCGFLPRWRNVLQLDSPDGCAALHVLCR